MLAKAFLLGATLILPAQAESESNLQFVQSSDDNPAISLDDVGQLGTLISVEDQVDHFICVEQVAVPDNPEETEFRAVFSISKQKRENGEFMEPGTYDQGNGYHADTKSTYSRNMEEAYDNVYPDVIIENQDPHTQEFRQQFENARAFYNLNQFVQGFGNADVICPPEVS